MRKIFVIFISAVLMFSGCDKIEHVVNPPSLIDIQPQNGTKQDTLKQSGEKQSTKESEKSNETTKEEKKKESGYSRYFKKTLKVLGASVLCTAIYFGVQSYRKQKSQIQEND